MQPTTLRKNTVSENITMEIEKGEAWKETNIICTVSNGFEEEFGYWMVASEYLLGLAASKSPAGFEQALDLIRKGAIVGWKRRKIQ